MRCGYVICPPACIKDPNSGKLSGGGIEALELICNKLGLGIQFTEEVGWATALEGLQTNRYDIIATPFFTNAARAKLADFSKPICYDPVFAYSKQGDSRFNDLRHINSPTVTIATIDGETSQVIASTDFPKAKQLSLPQMTDYAQLLLSVTSGKADVAICEPITAYFFQKTNPNSLRVIDPKNPLRMFQTCWMFKRGEPEFKAMLDTVLDEIINSGDMDKILNKYLPDPKLIYRIALPYRKDQ